MSEANASTPAASAVPETQQTSAQFPAEDAHGIDPKEQFSEEASETEGSAEEAIKEEIKKLGKKKLKLKVDGQELEEELDLDNEDELRKHLQLSKAAQKRMQEYASLKKEVEDLVKLIQNNPEQVLERAGLDVDALAEARLRRKIEEAQKSPEQKEREEMQRKLQEYEERIKREEEEKSRLQREAIAKEQMQQIDNEIIEVLQANPDLPHSPYVVKRIADTMIQALELAEDPNSGIDADLVTVKNIVPVVKQSIKNELQQMFGKLPEDSLAELLGENEARLRKFRLSRSKTSPPKETASQIKPTASAPKEQKPAEKLKAKDFFRSLGKK